MTAIKLCGLRRDEDIIVANRLKPDFVGFVFAKGSKREISFDHAQWLRAKLDPSIPVVGVFVNDTIHRIASIAPVLDWVQLHGTEDDAFIDALRARVSLPIIQAFRADAGLDLKRIEASTADLVLIDSGAGSGTPFDWHQVEGLSRPYLLAGGLTPANVLDAIATLAPWGVDVSSGVETEQKKDPQKMTAFVEALRQGEDQ